MRMGFYLHSDIRFFQGSSSSILCFKENCIFGLIITSVRCFLTYKSKKFTLKHLYVGLKLISDKRKAYK
jgi:hypothetical protein